MVCKYKSFVLYTKLDLRYLLKFEKMAEEKNFFYITKQHSLFWPLYVKKKKGRTHYTALQ